MRKKYIFLTTIITLLCVITTTYAYETRYVNASGLNCRQEPNLGAKVITTFRRGKELQLLQDGDSWCKVSDGNVTGWCYKKYLKASKPESTAASSSGTTSQGTYLGNFWISYYTCSPSENGGWGVTAKGQKLTDVVGVCIAADPKVIPYYSKVYIEGIGIRTVLDCGSAIKGNKIDVLVRSKSDIPSRGVHNAKVYLLN